MITELETRHSIKVLITQGLRTWQEQDALYAQGRTAPGRIVTFAKGGYSWHNFGLAFDIVPLETTGKPDWRPENDAWRIAANVGKTLGLEWGGDWEGKKRDLPHYQLAVPGLTLANCRDLYQAGGLPAVWGRVP